MKSMLAYQSLFAIVGAIIAATFITACTGTKTQQSSSLPSASTTPTPASATATELRADGVGAVKIGMNVDEVAKVANSELVTLQDEPLPQNIAQESCYYVKPITGSLSGVELMLNQGKVVRADIVQEGVIKTAAGVGVGTTEAKVEKTYAGQVQVIPDKYLPNGKNLIVTAPDQPNNRMIFETENGNVTSIRAGQMPEVEFVERCG